jgi:hypothetical protein
MSGSEIWSICIILGVVVSIIPLFLQARASEYLRNTESEASVRRLFLQRSEPFPAPSQWVG